MNKGRGLFVIYVALILFSPLLLSDSGEATSINMPFKQKIDIPIDTSTARYQPVDLHIVFNHPCWARNETFHSVRICYDDGSEFKEIESQIYELHFIDDSHIDSCNIVFIIPGDANGKEKYYVVYNDKETSAPDYTDHVNVEDAHYFYEPISGQKMDFDYYRITQDGYCIYGICQKGTLLGEGVSHTIIKLKPNSTSFESKNADQFASFGMSYAVDGERQYSGSARAEVVSKSILVDGNLMVRVRIESVSPEDNIKTSGIYTYYYSPTSTKRIVAHVNHQILDRVEVGGDGERDGTYASLSTFKSRSASIDDMNVGVILPSLHIYSEDGTVKEYSIPTNPESHKSEWILSTLDDVDLGSKAWLCIDDPLTGKTHALVFSSNTGLLEGDEDGIQVKASVKQVVKLPGLEADTGSLFATRNAYERGGEHNLVIPKGLNVTFDAEFVTTEKGGYEAIDRESEIFQKLTMSRPVAITNISKESEEKKKGNLTVYVHLAPSFPFGSLLSAVSGKNFSYIYAELYREGILSSGSVGRLSLSGDMNINLKNATLIQKVRSAVGLFDWKNASLFKKICFPDLLEGKYLIKIYRENPLFGREKEYIGFGTADVKGDTSIRIFCKPEGKLVLSVSDQHGENVAHVKFLLLSQETVVSDAMTDDNGSAVIKAPCNLLHSYKLQMIYKGLLIEEEAVKLKFIRHFLPLKKMFNLPLYRLNLRIIDSWGLDSAVDVNPILTSSEMIEKVSIKAEDKGRGKYLFSDIYPADYILKISYKSFAMERVISLDGDKSLDIIFPAEFTVDFSVLNSYGMELNHGILTTSREGKKVEREIGKNGRVVFSLPPGNYDVSVVENGKEIAKYPLDVKGNREIVIVSAQKSFIHSSMMYAGLIIAILSLIYVIWKRNLYYGIKFLAIAFIIVAFVSPWWMLTGESENLMTATNVLLYPPKMISMISTSSLLSGSIGSVPATFTSVLSLLSLMLIFSIILILIEILTKRRWKKISTILSIASIALLSITATLFFYMMSKVTEVGIGSFSGEGNMAITLPGLKESITVPCSWGGGVGFYMIIVAVAFLILSEIVKILIKKSQ